MFLPAFTKYEDSLQNVIIIIKDVIKYLDIEFLLQHMQNNILGLTILTHIFDIFNLKNHH